MNGEITSPFMTFNVSNVIGKNHYEIGKAILSHGLIPLNAVFDM